MPSTQEKAHEEQVTNEKQTIQSAEPVNKEHHDTEAVHEACKNAETDCGESTY